MLQFLVHHHATGELQKVLAILRFVFSLLFEIASFIFMNDQKGRVECAGLKAMPHFLFYVW